MEGGVPERGLQRVPSSRRLAGHALLDSSETRDDYIGEATALEGRLIFANGAPEDPWAAVLKMNSGSDPAVAERVAQGFLVTSNAGTAPDGGEDEWSAALAGGPNFISTDFPGERDGWFATIPGGSPARCNPVSAPPECSAAELEALD